MFRGRFRGIFDVCFGACFVVYWSYWALDETDAVGVRIRICTEVCIGEVKHAPFHEFLTLN